MPQELQAVLSRAASRAPVSRGAPKFNSPLAFSNAGGFRFEDEMFNSFVRQRDQKVDVPTDRKRSGGPGRLTSCRITCACHHGILNSCNDELGLFSFRGEILCAACWPCTSDARPMTQQQAAANPPAACAVARTDFHIHPDVTVNE
jgi:hypothetical protein